MEYHWKEAVIQACITANLEWEDDPVATLEKLVAWHVEMALDPAISERARALCAKPTMDNRTENKTEQIKKYGYDPVGYVLRKPGGDYALCAEGAVRWLIQPEYWKLMHGPFDAPQDIQERHMFGYAFQHEETGHIQCIDWFQIKNGWETNNPRWKKIGRAFLDAAPVNIEQHATDYAAMWADDAALHLNLLKRGYPRMQALHLAGCTDYDSLQSQLSQLQEENARLKAIPEYEAIYREKLDRLVMRHIDRMGDVCEQDTAENIIESFTKGFQPIFDEYLYAKFPGSHDLLEKQGRIKP